MKKAKYSFIFDRKKKCKNKNDVGFIILQIYFDRFHRNFINTKIKIRASEWDKKNKKVNAKNNNHILINERLRQIQQNIENYELKLITNNKIFTPEKLKDFLKGNDRKYFNRFYYDIVSKDMTISYPTKRDQLQTLNLLNEFNDKISFHELNYTLIYDFNNFLLAKKYSKSTIAKHHKNIKKYINLAIKMELFEQKKYPYNNFKPVIPRQKHKYLNYTEIQKIEDCDFSSIELFQVVKDMFLFSCYTGLRYSDFHSLTDEQFEQNDNGLILRLQRMQKVDRGLYLKLYELFDGKPQKIIEKYIDNNNGPIIWGKNISNSKMNLCLKEIGKKAGIKQPLTVHLGRHTFGTLFAHKSGNIFDVMKNMGISKFETAQIYINLSAEL